MSRRTHNQPFETNYQSQWLHTKKINGKIHLRSSVDTRLLTNDQMRAVVGRLKYVSGARQANALNSIINDMIDKNYGDIQHPIPGADLYDKARYKRSLEREARYKSDLNQKFLDRKEKYWNSINDIDPNRGTSDGYKSANTRDTIARSQALDHKQPSSREDMSRKAERQRQKSGGKPALPKNQNVLTRASNKIRKLNEGGKASAAMTKIASKGWFKKGILGLGALVAFNMVGNALSGFQPQPALPRHYERGYDVMSKHLTDFGSPLHLLKAARKTITPYFSSVRKGKRTSVGAIMHRNIALKSHKNAIGHMGY